MPAGAERILDARSLASSNRRLAELLAPGMDVLDAGCGTGAITRDIADAVGPRGVVVGADISEALLRRAAAERSNRPGPWFVRSDLFALPFRRAFDIVTAARVLQWVRSPEAAVAALIDAARPGGIVLVLDYDHEQIEWTPLPPPSMQRFYAAFLRWREEAGMDNAIAGRLPALFESAGLADIRVTPQHERTARGEADFDSRIGIWAEVAATRGHQMVADGVLAEAERAAAEADYRSWIQSAAESQMLFLLAVEGSVRT